MRWRCISFVVLNLIPAAATAGNRDEWLHRVELSRQRSAAFIEAARTRFGGRSVRIATNPVVAIPTVSLPVHPLTDPTLRDGDVVVVETGLLVYRGAPGTQHSFELLRTLQPGGVHANELRAIDGELARAAH